MNDVYHIFLVSDATGETAYRVIKAALDQFATNQIDFHWKPGTRTTKQVREIVEEAARIRGLIVHTLVKPELRRLIFSLSRQKEVECIDILGPILLRLSGWLKQEPILQPGLRRQLDEDYLRRIQTVEFALKHDDGQRVEELEEAEIVLVGVSRTMKTPLSIYLAYRGWMVANVPIVSGVEPPEILFHLPKNRVISLTIAPQRLALLREERLTRFGLHGGYSDLKEIENELRFAHSIFLKGGWQVLDVTSRSVEELAAEILQLAQPSPGNIEE